MASKVRNQKYEFRLNYSLVFIVPLRSFPLLPSTTNIWKRICIASRYLQLTRYPHFQFPIHNSFDSQFPIPITYPLTQAPTSSRPQPTIWKTVCALILHLDCHSSESHYMHTIVVIALKISAPCCHQSKLIRG